MRSAALALALLASVPAGRAQLPVSGRPVPTLSAFDDAMQDFMDEHDISAGVLGVMAEGRVVYLRGFGHTYDGTTALPENALFRLASCSKPFAAAVVQWLMESGTVAWDESDAAFDVGQAGGGVLDIAPWGGLEDEDVEAIEIRHLLRHTSGFTPSGSDPAFDWRDASLAMGLASPVSRTDLMRWILGTETLAFTPGTDTEYSNVGYLALSLIAEQETGQALIDVVRSRILTSRMWVPSTEVQMGRTFRADQDPREPRYESGDSSPNIYDDTPPYETVPSPYGRWPQPGLTGFGGMVASAPAMLEFLARYHAVPFRSEFGERMGTEGPGDGAHAGSLPGTNTWMQQRADSVYAFVAFNGRPGGDDHYGGLFYSEHLGALLDAVTAWPTATSDGFWVSTSGTGSSGTGGYNDVFASVGAALDYAQAGSKLRLNPGASSWTGTLSTRLLLDAPRGAAVLGD